MKSILKKLRSACSKKLWKYEQKKYNCTLGDAKEKVSAMINDFKSEQPQLVYDLKEQALLSKRKNYTDRIDQITRIRRDHKRTFLYYYFWPILFKLVSLRPIDPKLVVYADDRDAQLPANMKCIHDRLSKQGYHAIFCLKARSSSNKIIGQMFSFYSYMRFTYYYAHCKYVFLTDYYFPVNANKPRPGTQVIQLWHACGAFKKWGYSTLDAAWGGSRETIEKFPMHNNYTDVITSSEMIIPFYAEAFNCSQSIIYPLGVPRTDIYFDPEFVASGRRKMLELFPDIGDRKIILYAPTFRGNSMRGSYSQNMMDYLLLKKHLGDQYVLVNKLHPQVAKGFKMNASTRELLGDFIFDASKTMDIDTALCGADIVISDYSSLIFEYALLERPMLFYAYDLAQYDRDRSFYCDYQSFIPGPIVTDTMEIIEAVKNAEKNLDVDRLRKFRQDFMSACDGHATDRIIEHLLSKK